MSTNNFIKLFTIILLISFSLNCRCMRGTIEEDFDSSDIVFEGIAVQATKISQFKQITQFEVIQTFKGEHAKERFINTNISSASCGIEFQTGKVYTIFATQLSDKSLITNSCTRTMISEDEVTTLLTKLK
jgi:hypothetical protein